MLTKRKNTIIILLCMLMVMVSIIGGMITIKIQNVYANAAETDSIEILSDGGDADGMQVLPKENRPMAFLNK